MKRIAIYARVSTDKQTTENQIQELRKVAERMDYTIVSEFVDNGISGAKSREDRPALDSMLKSAAQRKFDLVICWDVTRLGRSLQNLIETLNELQALKIDLFFVQNGINTETPSGKMMFSIAGAFAEFERSLIRERVIAGQQRAKKSGKHIGRPSNMNDGMRNAIKILREKGMGIVAISKQLGVGVGTCYKALNMM